MAAQVVFQLLPEASSGRRAAALHPPLLSHLPRLLFDHCELAKSSPNCRARPLDHSRYAALIRQQIPRLLGGAAAAGPVGIGKPRLGQPDPVRRGDDGQHGAVDLRQPLRRPGE